MFWQRFISTLILVPLILGLIFYGNPWALGAFVLLVFLAVSSECLALIPLQNLSMKIGFFLLMLFCLWACHNSFSYWLVLGFMLWAGIIFAILTFPASQNYWGYPFVVACIFLVLIPLMFQSMIHLYSFPNGKKLLVYLFFLIWSSDIGAYLSGKLLGTHKLIPKVSPGKSWEGLLGGVSLSMLVTWAGFSYFHPGATLRWFILALCTVISALFGDLFISILKRRCHLKDTGAVIPGHGGVLDRLDSLIPALPLFYFALAVH